MNEQIKRDRFLLENWKGSELENGVNTIFSLRDRHNTISIFDEKVGTIEEFIQNLLEAQVRLAQYEERKRAANILFNRLPMDLGEASCHAIADEIINNN
jgi:hypothetical protein